MGCYVRGTAGFTFKYRIEQDTNLERLRSWAELEGASPSRSLAGQFYAPFGSPNLDAIDGASWATSVYDAALPPFDLSASVESAIYQVSDAWPSVVAQMDASVPGPLFFVDVGQLGVRFDRSQWAALAARIGRGADPSKIDSLVAARDAAFDDGGDEYLPHLAACALLHAVRNDLDAMSMVDQSRFRDTNLWECVADVAGRYNATAPFEARALRVRLFALCQSKPKALEYALELLRERPTDLSMFRTVLSVHLWNNEAPRIEALTDELLSHTQSDAMRAELHHYRGDARWTQRGPDAARDDASAARALGLDGLQQALDENTRAARRDRRGRKK